jgi:cyclopropane-fatty-acyl-phospholipid synthase
VVAIFCVYAPLVVGAAAWNALAGPFGWAESAAVFAAGLLLWTLIEYLLHRFAFHGFAPHYEHHARPAERRLILAPLWFSLLIASLLWAASRWAMGSWAGSALLAAGVICGYLFYEWVHLRIHSGATGGALLRGWRRYHFHHHFKDERVRYGITSPLWDFAFGSRKAAERD